MIGYLPEERGLYPKMKVRDQLVYLARLRGMQKQDILKQIDYWLERFKVPEYATKKLRNYQKGTSKNTVYCICYS